MLGSLLLVIRGGPGPQKSPFILGGDAVPLPQCSWSLAEWPMVGKTTATQHTLGVESECGDFICVCRAPK